MSVPKHPDRTAGVPFGRRLLMTTAHSRLLPSYLVVGVKRAGTSTLQQVIAQHPAVLPPNVPKGTRYFDVNHGFGWEWFRSHFPSARRAEVRARRIGMPVVTGEASPYYLFHPLAPSRIRAALPGVRLVVVLRDPVERAWSHHAYEVARGFEQLSFEAAIDAEHERLLGEEERLARDPTYVSRAHRHHSYLARGRYDVQLARLFSCFPPDDVLVLDHGELFADPVAGVGRVQAFLGLPPVPPRRVPRLKPSGAPGMPATVRRRLAERFAASNAATFALVGREFAWSAP